MKAAGDARLHLVDAPNGNQSRPSELQSKCSVSVPLVPFITTYTRTSSSAFPLLIDFHRILPTRALAFSAVVDAKW